MAQEIIKNIHLVNAPAGSGKTTTIKKMIGNILVEKPNDQILCITYTNRAADELKKGLDSSNIFIGTIHSFINQFINVYFSHRNMLELYFEIYEAKIKDRILNKDIDENVSQSNEKYIQKYETLNIETIRANVNKLSYNEAEFSALYYGQLSHNDLLSFSRSAIERFPILRTRLKSKFQTVFIDEYQDTSADALSIFIDAFKNTKTEVYLFGDKMQQIYKNYDGSLEEAFSQFDSTFKLSTNYRSAPVILSILNNLYNDPSFIQQADPDNNIKVDFAPRILLCKDLSKVVEDQSKEYPDTLTLFVLNQARFNSIGAGELYKRFSKMERYSFPSKYNAANILSDATNENPDALARLLFLLSDIFEKYNAHQFGGIIQLFKSNKMFCLSMYNVQKHSDKTSINQRLLKIKEFCFDSENFHNIKECLEKLLELEAVETTYIEDILNDEDYKSVLEVPFDEFNALTKYLADPTVSTQHGVKGESHNNVLFVAEDSSNPMVSIYSFFEVWSKHSISLRLLEDLYYDFGKQITNLEVKMGVKFSNLSKDTYTPWEDELIPAAERILESFSPSKVFVLLYKKSFEDYVAKPNKTKAVDCFKISRIYGVLSAYRLFYVGCSRARKNLTVLVDKNKIKTDVDTLIEKFKGAGFEVIDVDKKIRSKSIC